MAEQRTNFIDADDLRPILKFVSKNWLIIIGFSLIAFVIAYFFSHRLPSIYAARTEILLEPTETYDYQAKVNKDLGYYSILSDITNQKRILGSYDLIHETLEKVNFSISYYLVGRVKTLQVDNFDAIRINADWKRMEPKLYNQPFSVKILDLKNYELSYQIGGKQMNLTCEFGKLYEDINYAIQVDLAPHIDESRLDAVRDQNFQFKVHPLPWLITKYLGKLKIENAEFTSIFTLTCTDELPSRAKIFLDTLAQVYTDYTLRNQLAINENTQKYIDLQLEKLVVIMDSLEYLMENFKDARDITDLSREQVETFDDLSRKQDEQINLDMRMKAMDALEEFLYKEEDGPAIPPVIYQEADDEAVNRLITDLFQLRQKKAALLVDLKETDLRVQRVDSSTKSIRNIIFRYARETRAVINARIAETKKEIGMLEERLSAFPKSVRDLHWMERKLIVNEKMYTFLLEKKANTVIARAGIIPDATIIEKARSLGVVGPDRNAIIYLYLGIGLIAALVIGLIRMIFFERIDNIREMKSLSKIPVLGGVPNYLESDVSPLALVASPRGNISEAFRSLRTNLQYMLPSDSSKIILVTSLHPGEGKTFVSVNLALVLAKASKKVIILDFDLHKPKVHKMFGLENVSGISSYLVGRNDYRDSILTTQIENLDCITAGPVPPNASELILNSRVDTILTEMTNRYDYVIIDTPPLMLISDALVLLNKVNLGIFVFNTEKATKQGLRYLEDVLSQNNQKSNAVLLNNIKQKRWKYYYGKYAHRYGYGYGYGYGYSYGAYGYNSSYYYEDEKKSRKKKGKNGIS